MNICSKCNIEKNTDEYPVDKRNKRGCSSVCKICTKKYKSDYYLSNKDIILKNGKKYTDINRDSIKEYKAKYYKENKNIILDRTTLNYNLNRENKIEYQKLYYLNNSDSINKQRNLYVKNKMESDDIYRVTRIVRSLVSSSIKRRGYKKSSKTSIILGCSFIDFKLYLESKFEQWMTFENHGKFNGELNYGWDIDHIVPISSAKTKKDIIRLNHYTNLQPLCSKVNRYIKKDNNICQK
jgi:hypothetical protein